MALRDTVPPLAKPVEAVRVNFSLPIRPLPWAATCELRRGIREFRVSHRIFFVEEQFGAFASPLSGIPENLACTFFLSGH